LAGKKKKEDQKKKSDEKLQTKKTKSGTEKAPNHLPKWQQGGSGEIQRGREADREKKETPNRPVVKSNCWKKNKKP